MVELAGYPAFARFLFRVARDADMWAATSGSEDRHLREAEGRRSLGFDIFSWVEAALSPSSPAVPSIHTMAMVLAATRREEQPPGGSEDEDHPDSDADDVRR